MKNDAKFGMLAGVLGVVVAAVLFANNPPPAAQSQPAAPGEPKAKASTPMAATAPAAPTTPSTATTANAAALPSTPVARTRKETDAQPTARSGASEEEP